MKKRKLSLFLIASIISLCGSTFTAKAFQPVSHCLLIESIATKLPKDSIISQAVKQYPEIANWGANGLDLGYLQPGQVLDRAPWADRFHYYKVGTFAKEQLQDAIKSKDMKKISFAAGWVSHLTGDLASHGTYVNPECGVYLDNPSTRPLHKKLENNAEIYVFSKLTGNSLDNFNKTNISNKFAKADEIPFDLVNSIANRVYGQSPSKSEETLWCTALTTGLKTGVGYNYTNYDEAKKFLAENNREERLIKAFKQAEIHGVKLLGQAEKGDYSGFTDRWNLDVGHSNSPISSLTVTVETGKKVCAGTDDNVYVTIELKNGKSKEWQLNKKNYNDFEYGDYDEYYLYINDVDFKPEDVVKTYISKTKGTSQTSDWYLKGFKINVNGINAVDKDVNKWVTDDKNKEEVSVNWSNIKNTVDPSIN